MTDRLVVSDDRLVVCGPNFDKLAIVPSVGFPCFCADPNISCSDIIVTCPLFCHVPTISWSGSNVWLGNFTISITYDLDLDRQDVGGGFISIGYISKWGGITSQIGSVTFTSSVSHFNVGTVPMFSRREHANNAGFNVNQGEAFASGARVVCTVTGDKPGPSTNLWLLQASAHSFSTFQGVSFCPKWRHETGSIPAICATNSMVFDLEDVNPCELNVSFGNSSTSLSFFN